MEKGGRMSTQRLRVRNLKEVYEGWEGCPPGKAVSFFATKDPDGVIALHRGIYYDPSQVKVSERNDNLICTYYHAPSCRIRTRDLERAFIEKFALNLHRKFDIEEM